VQRAAVVAIGPGIGRSPDVVGIVAAIWRDAACPVVVDADALWALARLPRTTWPLHAGPRIVTPHAGEMARLAGHEGEQRAERDWLEQAARHLAHDAAVVVVLKGAGSLVVDGSGESRNETGNPGLATAGTGDVLTGVVAALVAQGLAPFAAARLGAWLHGRAGDVAAQAFGEWSLTARDVIDRLHVAIREAARAG
jgi:NAD(P)H-hydrate epimerase